MSIKSVTQRDQLGSQLMKQAIAEGGPLGEGAQKRAVAYLERALQTIGFDPGTKDNKFTAETAKAVRQFQAAWGLKATGKLDERTLNKLDHTLQRARKHGSGCPDCNQPGFQGSIGVGQKNLDAFQAEQNLKKLGYDTGKVDGVFDQKTAEAVRQFKKDQPELKKDSKSGLVDKKTFQSLQREANELRHAPYRRRVTEGHAQQRRLDAATAEAAKKQNADGTRGIGAGSSKRAVENVQKHLKAAGYDPQRTDGVWDERTANSLKTFQKKSGLKESERVTPATWAQLSKSFTLAKGRTDPAQSLGERSAAVLASEKLLKKAGFNPGKVDGIFDRATQKASRAFEQRFKGTGSDGRIGENQLERMKTVARAKQNPGSGPTLKEGYRGAPVKALQKRLDQLGYANGANDGVFGNQTERAVKKFQRDHGLPADGVVGPKTWRMLGIDVKGKVQKPGSVGGGGSVTSGGGWGGSEKVANAAKSIAASMGIPVTSQKRNLADTIRVGSTTASDHYTGNKTAFAVDFGVSGARGDQLARAIAQKYGIPLSNIGTFNGHNVRINGATYRLQLLWRVAGHFDHVHFGIRRQ
jgi:peptidoglycan hydrolase-like protein with peptidoglycan-binding domain